MFVRQRSTWASIARSGGGVGGVLLVVFLTRFPSAYGGLVYTPEQVAPAAISQVEEVQALDPKPIQRASLVEGQQMRTVPAVTDFEELKLRWEKKFGGNRRDVFTAVLARKTDLATIAVGQSMSVSSGGMDAWVLAVNESGKQLWQTSIGGPGDDRANAVVEVDDGATVVVGDSVTGGRQAGLVAKLDASGRIVWTKHITGPSDISLSTVIKLPTEHFLVAGRSALVGYLAELDQSGEVIWQRRLSAAAPDNIRAMVRRPNGQIIAVGERTAEFESDAWVANLSPKGDVLWTHGYGGDGRDVFHDVVILNDGTVLAVGETFSGANQEQGWLVEILESNEAGWSKIYGGNGVDSLSGISVLSDQSLVLVGHTDAQNSASANSWVLRVTQRGVLIKARTLGADVAEGLSAIAARSDGSFATVGFENTEYGLSKDAYVALLGMPISNSRTLVYADSANAPTLFVPGGGELITERATVEILGNVIHNRPVKQLFVDGKQTEVLPNGAFVKRISVPIGKTTITVEAVDDRNLIGSTTVSVVRTMPGALQPPNMDELIDSIAFGEYHALIIGNDKYVGDLPQLRTAVKDAQAVAGILQEDYDFNVDLMLNATRSDIVSALQRKSSELGANDNLLVYYAGHGYYDEDTDLGYWLPVDATMESKDLWIRNSEIRDSIKEMNAKHVLLVADSCFSGTLLRNVDVKRTGRFYEQMANRSARLVMTSGGIEPVIDGGGDGHSIFARSLLRKLSSSDQIIDGTSLYQAIREPVVMISEQVPQYSNIRFIDSDGGDFLFVKKTSLSKKESQKDFQKTPASTLQ